MQFRSINNLATLIRGKLHLIPKDVTLIIGLPRSGMLPATLISLYLNKPLGSLDLLLDKKFYKSGSTRLINNHRYEFELNDSDVILIVDDSIASGGSIKKAKDAIKQSKIENKIYYSAIYGSKRSTSEVDVLFEKVSFPRMFEWNALHHNELQNACVDIDGVLCKDPKISENDDGIRYQNFLKNAEPKFITHHYIEKLVTSRLEKYRPETETWLKKYSINYGELVMLNLPNAKSRIEYGAAKYKAEIYKKSSSIIFIESEKLQALEIAKISGKPVICTDTQEIYYGESFSLQNIKYAQHTFFKKLSTKVKIIILKILNK